MLSYFAYKIGINNKISRGEECFENDEREIVVY